MRRAGIKKFLCALCILGGCASAAGSTARHSRSRNMIWMFAWIRAAAAGRTGKIVLRNDSAQPQKNAALQISSSLNWRSIRAGGKPLQFVSQPFTSDMDHTGALSEAIVTLPAEVKPKDSVELEIGYEGVIPLDMTRLTRVGIPEEIARHTSWDQIGRSFTAVRGSGYVAWYPITTESADFSEGNSLFEVVNRWKAREAGSEFNARFELLEAGGDTTSTVICSGVATGTASSESGKKPSESERTEGRQVRANCAWKQLGLVAPTFAAANYTSSSKPPLTGPPYGT